MKKILLLTLALFAVCLPVLAESAPNFAPDVTAAPGIDGSVPDPADSAKTAAALDIAVEVTYETLTNDTYNLTMAYPSGWSQIPGRYTICFVENVADGQTPARIALTRKTVSSTPDEKAISKQMVSYLKALQTQYDTFEVGDLASDSTFVGQTGYSTEYTAKKGEVSVKGYVIMAAIEKHLYAFHFSSSEAAYESYGEICMHLRDAVSIGK